MVQGESPKEQKELLVKARPVTEMAEEERTCIFGSGNHIWDSRLITIEWAGVGQEGETVYALNDFKLCICVFVKSTDIPGTTDVDDICLDSIEGDTIEFIIAKGEVEVLSRQWRLATSVIHQDSPAYTE